MNDYTQIDWETLGTYLKYYATDQERFIVAVKLDLTKTDNSRLGFISNMPPNPQHGNANHMGCTKSTYAQKRMKLYKRLKEILYTDD